MLPISKRMFDCTNLLFDSVMLTLSFLHLNGTLASVSHEIVKFDPITAYFWMGSSVHVKKPKPKQTQRKANE